MTTWSLYTLDEVDTAKWEHIGEFAFAELIAKITDTIRHIEKPVAIRVER